METYLSDRYVHFIHLFIYTYNVFHADNYSSRGPSIFLVDTSGRGRVPSLGLLLYFSPWGSTAVHVLRIRHNLFHRY